MSQNTNGCHGGGKVDIKQGEILSLKSHGQVIREKFNTAKLDVYEPFWYGGGCCRPYSYGLSDTSFKLNTAKGIVYGTYLESLIDYGANVGVAEEEILCLYENGFDEEEIEALLFSPDILHEYVNELFEYGFA